MHIMRRGQAFAKRVLELILLFAIARIIAGVLVLALFSRDAVAWGWPLTAITAGVFAICLGTAMLVRRSSVASSA
jgi:uncharacterized membrane protein HdeD (DUF308 family)